MDNLNNEKDKIDIDQNNINIYESKGPINYLIGSITSFMLSLGSFFISKKIAIYFATHKPSNSTEIVQSISSSLNTLIVGLSFLATFSFGFIGLGLFIVFIRSFFIKNS